MWYGSSVVRHGSDRPWRGTTRAGLPKAAPRGSGRQAITVERRDSAGGKRRRRGRGLGATGRWTSSEGRRYAAKVAAAVRALGMKVPPRSLHRDPRYNRAS